MAPHSSFGSIRADEGGSEAFLRKALKGCQLPVILCSPAGMVMGFYIDMKLYICGEGVMIFLCTVTVATFGGLFRKGGERGVLSPCCRSW